MVKVLRGLVGLHRQAAIVVSLLVMMMATMVAVPLGKTSAAGCNYYSEWFSGPMNGYSYTPTHRVPPTSGCRDINIQNVWHRNGSNNVCIQVTVRFYPSTGNSYTNGWKQFCGGWGARVLASDVRDNTIYRIEANYGSEYVGYSVRMFD